MKIFSNIVPSQTLSSALRFLWLLALAAVICWPAHADTSGLTESTQAFYRGDYVQAAELAEKYLRQHPNDAPTRLILARAELAQGKFRQAFKGLQKVLASDPNNIEALFYLSLIGRELSHREYERLFSIAPDSARVHQLLGEAALAAENKNEAVEEFQKALSSNPRFTEVSTELAELKRSQSQFDEAILYYKRAEQIGPLNYEIAYGLGACYTYQQQYPKAIEWLRKAIVFAPDSAAGRFALGNALFQNGQLEAAIPELNFSLKLEPRMKQAYFLLGRAYSRLGRMNEAKAALKKLDELNRAEIPGQEEGSGGGANPKPDRP
ncbi:MAG TPA: tetratricopeptide repeat protein [Candidatus Dormibacteraeota bacterium]|nr:tetratricopeptide repeat protein [Candidatus Dormibacteraeota bacterium]